jgi:hypothetical protein
MNEDDLSQELLVKALQCRELAALSDSPALRSHLLDLAEEHEATLAVVLGDPKHIGSEPLRGLTCSTGLGSAPGSTISVGWPLLTLGQSTDAAALHLQHSLYSLCCLPAGWPRERLMAHQLMSYCQGQG